MADTDDLKDPELRYVPVTFAQLSRAEREVESCEACNAEAEIPFDLMFREVASDQGYVEYILPAPAKCPNCFREIHEKTLVHPQMYVEFG